MIDLLPKTLFVKDKEYKIQTDFRIYLSILQLFEDNEISQFDKVDIMLRCIYDDCDFDDLEEAFNEAKKFLDRQSNSKKEDFSSTPIMFSWTQDIHLIMDAILKVNNGVDIREKEYVHWWTFLGMFNSITESTFTEVLRIRHKISFVEKMTDQEKEFYNNNRDLIDLKIEDERLSRESDSLFRR